MSQHSHPSYHGSNYDREEKLGDLSVHDLSKLLLQMEEEKNTSSPIYAASPFSRAILESPPPPTYFKHHPELIFDGDDDPAAYYTRFNMTMDIYQIHQLTKCTLCGFTKRKGSIMDFGV